MTDGSLNPGLAGLRNLPGTACVCAHARQFPREAPVAQCTKPRALSALRSPWESTAHQDAAWATPAPACLPLKPLSCQTSTRTTLAPDSTPAHSQGPGSRHSTLCSLLLLLQHLARPPTRRHLTPLRAHTSLTFGSITVRGGCCALLSAGRGPGSSPHLLGLSWDRAAQQALTWGRTLGRAANRTQ